MEHNPVSKIIIFMAYENQPWSYQCVWDAMISDVVVSIGL